MDVGLVGLGNMGIDAVLLVAGKGHQILTRKHVASVVEEVNHRHASSRFLPGVVLPVSFGGRPILGLKRPEGYAKNRAVSSYLHLNLVFSPRLVGGIFRG